MQSPVSNVSHPDWTASAVLYEVNVRQYTKEGTFKAFEKHLPRLKELGVDILWFMPVYPRGGHPLVHARVSHRRGGAQG